MKTIFFVIKNRKNKKEKKKFCDRKNLNSEKSKRGVSRIKNDRTRKYLSVFFH